MSLTGVCKHVRVLERAGLVRRTRQGRENTLELSPEPLREVARRILSYGRFVQIHRPRLVEYTWMSEATQGAESVVNVTLEARGEETEVLLRHSGVPDDEMGRQHKEGWAWMLSALADGMAARRSASSSD